jgi:hypothetical protein
MVARFRASSSADLFPDGSYAMAVDPTSSSKFQPVYEGPFLVVRHTTGRSYVLLDSD